MSTLQLRLKNCIQTILELEPQIGADLSDRYFVEEFMALRRFLDSVEQMRLGEDDVERLESATAVWGINLIIFCHMIWGSEGLIAYRELKQKHAAIEAEIASIDAENRSLSRDIRLLQTDERYVEKMIRQRLHYVHENEVLYLFGDSSENRESGAATHDGQN